MNNKRTTQHLPTIFRVTGFVIAVVFLILLKRGGENLPEEGVGGSGFYTLMIAVGALIFAIGSIMRFRNVMRNQKKNDTEQ